MILLPTQFQTTLLAWFDIHGRKSLPWQLNKTPYRVWVSEIMLQQTQVNTVIPYFERFMQNFPHLLALAEAHEDTVLHLWAGLGYYSRARNLHLTAKIIVEKYSGKFPNTLTELQALPGIGPSTAGAILSLAYNQPTPILDGNVKRVLARLHGIVQPINETATKAALWGLATQYTPKKRVADYTQAMMDLGATLCTRGKPACERCPFINHCFAQLQQMIDRIPMKKNMRKIPTRSATFLIIKKNKQILLYKRPSIGIWGGLFCLPEISGDPGLPAIRAFCQKNFQLSIETYHPLESFRHTFSHYHLNIFPVLVEITKKPLKAMEDGKQIWYNLGNPKSIGLPKPIQSILRGLL